MAKRLEVVQLYLAVFKAGLIAVPINWRLKPAEIAWIVDDSGAAICFAQSVLADAVRSTGIRTITDIPVPSPALSPLQAQHEMSPALILYTSGSTGRPKGAVHTHQSLMITGEILTEGFEEAYGEGIRPRAMLMTPLMHASGVYMMLGALRLGGSCVLLPTFDPGAALDALERFRCTLTIALPAMIQFMLAEQAQRPRDLSALQVIFAGGDSVPVALHDRVREVMGVATVEALAQTETGPTLRNPLNAPRAGSLGLVHHRVEVRVVDKAGHTVQDDEAGELLVRSPALTAGYWRNSQATDEALRNGWFATGDLVSRDADGFYWFRGRLKEIIIRGGSNISPQEVEEALYSHPSVLEAGVVGMPHDVWGEVVVAVVALREGAEACEADLQEHARKTLADYKVPERVHFLPVLPKGPTGKVHRRALKDALNEPATH